MQIDHTPVLGETAPRSAVRTAQKLGGFALRYVDSIQMNGAAKLYLDVGCGNGLITELVSPGFDEVVGIDVEDERLEEFRSHVADRQNFRVLRMSANDMAFPSETFSLVTSFEVLEHVEDLEGTVREIVRVCKRGGVVVVSTPHAWFPLESHGVRVRGQEYWRKVPLLPYIRPLHRRYALARVFSSGEMDRLFTKLGMESLATGYAAPQFERSAASGASWESKLVFLRSFFNRCERVPMLRALIGISMLKAYRKRV